MGIFGIGVTAIQNAQIGLMTTEHNISNVNTPGYSRQRAVQQPNIAVLTGSGYIGQGAHVATIDRMYSSFIETQVNRALSTVSQLQGYADQLGQINNMLADTSAGMSPAFQNFFKGVQQATADPAALAPRQSMVSSAQAMTSRFQALELRLSQQYDEVNGQVYSNVNNINAHANQIAELNGRIVVAQSSMQQPPNDLYDMRDNAVAELNKLVGVQTTVNSDGTYNVYIGNGQQLVTSTRATTMVAMPSSQDAGRLTVGLQSTGGTQELPESLVTGGALGGVLNFRSEFLDRSANDLGRIAISMALTFNAQQALGQDLNGRVAGDPNFVSNFFVVPTPRVVANTNNPAGSPSVAINFAPPSYNGNFYTNLTNSDYRLTKNASTGDFSLIRLSDNAQLYPNNNGLTLEQAANADGFSFGATALNPATFPNTASYLIMPTREGARNVNVNPTIAADVRQIALAAPVFASVSTTNTGNATISPGNVLTGYSLTGAPFSLRYSNTGFNNNGAPPIPGVPVGPGPGISGFPVDAPVTITPLNGTPFTITPTPGTSASVPYINGATISFNGLQTAISGLPGEGDTFSIARNSNGISDNRNAMRLGQLQTQSTMSGQSATYQGVYAQLVSDAGSKGNQVQVTLEAQQALLEQSMDQRQGLSGVNLDEEAANLMRYQQAYQAASKMLTIGSKLFDSILAI